MVEFLYSFIISMDISGYGSSWVKNFALKISAVPVHGGPIFQPIKYLERLILNGDLFKIILKTEIIRLGGSFHGQFPWYSE